MSDRIRRVELTNFRGWGQEPSGEARSIDTDADLVIVTGANGFGKSSLFEALVLLLTNHRVNQPAAEEAVDWAQLGHHGKPWSLGATIHTGERDWKAHITSPTEEARNGPLDRTDPWWQYVASSISNGGQVPSDMLAAAISFFQDDVRANLDDARRRTTLVNWHWAIAPALRKLRGRLPELREDASRRQESARAERVRLGTPDPGLQEKVATCSDELRSFLDASGHSALARLAQLGANPLGVMQNLAWEAEDAAHARGLREAPSDRARKEMDSVREIVGRLVNALEALAGAGSEVPRQALEDRLREAEATRNELDDPQGPFAVMSWAQDETVEDGCRIDVAIGALSRNLSRWREVGNAPSDPRLKPLLDELARLDPGTLATLAGTTKEVVATAERALAKRATLDEEIERLREQLSRQRVPDGLRRSLKEVESSLLADRERLRRLDEIPRPEALERISRGFNDLEILVAELLEGRTDGELQQLLAKVLDETLVRFAPRQGFLPVRPELRTNDDARWHLLVTGDNRPWTDVSTGQKAQLGLAWMLAHALALRERLPAQILVLDDTSTAFDTGNLARQTTWLRQLAYHPEDSERWQIFLASHHDELTSRLVKHLRPPEGRSLRVIDFTSWQPNFGPTLKTWQANPPHAERSTSVRLGDAMKLAWAEPPRRRSA